MFWLWRPIEASVTPVLVGFKAIPLIALAPLISLWFGGGMVAKAVMAATVCFFPIVNSLSRGALYLPREEEEYLRSVRMGKLDELLRYRLLRAMPLLFAGLRVGSVLAVVGAVVAEFVAARVGLGVVVLTASLRIQTDILIAGIILSGLCGVLFYAAVGVLEDAVLKRLRMSKVSD